MLKKIYAIVDYKHSFLSKWSAKPYRSGYNKEYLRLLFRNFGFEINFINFSEVDFSENWQNRIILYTSSEEPGYYYKKFIEDIISGLELAGAILIPNSNLLRANNNKVFMEILRQVKLPEKYKTITAQQFGTYEESELAIKNGRIKFPCVIKIAEGAMSKGVFLAKTENEYIELTKRITRTYSIKVAVKEWFRSKKHIGYVKESLNQQKFIVQPFIDGLKNDWKILIYGSKYYILRRNIRPNDFRASGSGYNYSAGSAAEFPLMMFPFVKEFYESLNVPNLSIDFAFDGKEGYILEFQGIHFGTSTHFLSKDYYDNINDQWVIKCNEMDQEELYVYSIINFLNKRYVEGAICN